MISLNECLTKDTKIFLIGEEQSKCKKFSLTRKRPAKKIFRKDFNHAEIIGEAICGIRNLRSAHFFLIGEGYFDYRHWVPYSEIKGSGYHIKLGSYDFCDTENFTYFKICDTSGKNHNYLDDVLDMAPTEENRCELLNEIEELFALDTFMGQIDRFWSNILFEKNKKTKELHLAPVYDFQYSLKKYYMDPKMLYDNFLYHFQTREDYFNFMREHPEFADKLCSYLDIDLVELIKRSYRTRGLQVPDSKAPFYEEFAKERKEFIKSITRGN